MTASKVILIGPSTYGSFDRSPLERIEKAGFVIRPNPVGRKMNREELKVALEGVVGIIAGLEPLAGDILAGSQLKVISRCGVGLDNVDLPAAERLGIRVFSTPNAPTVAVAELTVGVMLTLLRRVAEMDRSLRAGKWEKLSGPQLNGKTVAIVGLGRIGLKVATLLRPFGVRLLGVDPGRHGEVEGIPIVSLAEALRESEIVSIHASGSAEIVGAREFAQMRPKSYLLNAGRGGLVNEPALAEALDRGVIAGAWLDAFREEPYSGMLRNYPQVVLTPHIGYSSDEARKHMELEAAENLLQAFAS